MFSCAGLLIETWLLLTKLFSNVPKPHPNPLLLYCIAVGNHGILSLIYWRSNLQKHVLSASINGTSFQHLTRWWKCVLAAFLIEVHRTCTKSSCCQLSVVALCVRLESCSIQVQSNVVLHLVTNALNCVTMHFCSEYSCMFIKKQSGCCHWLVGGIKNHWKT